jgi:hypothetical protein
METVSFSEIIAKTDVEMQQLGWTLTESVGVVC